MEPSFVDREDELAELTRLALHGYYPVLYLYGPEGCGKTRLLKELALRLSREGHVAIYIDAQSTRRPTDTIQAPPEIVKAIVDAIAHQAGPAGKLIALAITSLAKWLSRERVKGPSIVMLVDDIARPIGLDQVEAYAKDLLNLVEELYSLEAKSVLVLASTSEGRSRLLLARHSYVRLRELWSLSREAMEALLSQLKAPKELSDDPWKVTGGNPRAVIDLWRRGWNVHGWLRELEVNVKALLSTIDKSLLKPLKAVVEDPDRLVEEHSLRDLLIDANLIAPIDRPCLGYTPPQDPELGIGSFYAWQLPAYKLIVDKYLTSLL